jgi:hypothetical protein
MLSVIVIPMVAVAVYGVTEARARVDCLAYGYPAVKVDMALRAYCVRRVDQTDVVVPLDKVLSERR